MKTRAVVTIELFVYGDSDAEIVEQATVIATKLREKEDNQAAVLHILEQPFGTTKNRKIV